MAEPNLIYKMTVLSLLSKVDCPLSNAQIVDFFLDREYTDYFTIQQILGELTDADLLLVTAGHNQTLYEMTPAGRNTLQVMRDKINPEIEEDLLSYLKEHQIEIREESALSASYDRYVGGGYIVHCQYTLQGQVILDLTMHTSSSSQAQTICNNWKARHEEVYMNLMDTLIQ